MSPISTRTVTNTRVLFNERPTGFPEPGKTTVLDKSEVVDIDNIPLNGGVLVKLLVISVDPYLRGKMNAKPVYEVAYEIGKPIHALAVSKVVRSDDQAYAVGDLLYGNQDFAEYAVLPKDALSAMQKIDNKVNLPLSLYVGTCGMPGRTAYFGYRELFSPYVKKGDTLFVTTGAGAVGSLVIQLAKADGLKVITFAGSDEKVKFAKELGADVAFNYKTTSTQEMLEKHGPINFYWDHVGGETLDLALEAAANYARFVECGMITGYNGQGTPIKNTHNILWKRLTLSGFIVSDLEGKYGQQFLEDIPARVASGQIKYAPEDIREGLESVGQALYDGQAGKNTGKVVIHVADP